MAEKMGILGRKLGMTRIFDGAGAAVPVTVIEAGPCPVTQVKTADTDGYNAVQLGFGAVKAKKVTKPEAGHFAKADVTPRKHLVELRTADASEFELGQELTAEVFADGEIVGVWTHSLAIGRHDEHPAPDLLVPGTAADAEVTAALDRYRLFITG